MHFSHVHQDLHMSIARLPRVFFSSSVTEVAIDSAHKTRILNEASIQEYLGHVLKGTHCSVHAQEEGGALHKVHGPL